MKSVVVGFVFTLLILSSLSGVHAAGCQNVNSFTASCTGGTITQDTYNGCRTIKCASGSSSMQVLACDKPDGAVPQYFEMYKQSKIGTAVTKICLGSLCLEGNGYAKSAAYSTYTCGSTPPSCVPTTEICDNKDNNCNGQIDEGVSRQASCGVGTCARTMTQTCNAGAYGPACTPLAPTTEICDNKDNNCNGQVDENNVCAPVTPSCSTSAFTSTITCTSTITKDDSSTGCRSMICGTGGNTITALACNKAGYFEIYRQGAAGIPPKLCLGTTCIQNEGYVKSAACTATNATNTTPACVPTAEICDNKDNDCDGIVDEELTKQVSCGIGMCAKTTTQTCSAGAYSPACTPGSPSSEICDNKDNDCDGLIDENNVCAPACVPTTEICDNKDNNCNGQVDEGLTRTISCGVGVCARTTTQSCNAGAYGPACAPGTPTTEVCDNKDNNCNGQVDEGLTKQVSCGVGACLRTTTQSCNAGAYGPACAPGTPTTEVCNSIDDNCNGVVDENSVCGSVYPLKTNIVSTIFWVGQGPSADTGWSNNYDSAWDVWWQEHYGGYDDPNNRTGYYPAGFTPQENPFYVAIPYTDYSTTGRKPNAFSVVPWSNEKTTWGSQESMIKNRWVKVIKGPKTVYAQVENAGPGPTDDWQYVFGSNPQPTTDFGWHAGIDVSPAVRDYLGLGAVDTVSWQWVAASAVPAGPWKTIVTTRQSCWDSTICP